MDLRALGHTGVNVSPLCLGAMMFGAWGNTDHEDSIRIIHRALDAGINSSTPPTSTRVGSRRRSSARRSRVTSGHPAVTAAIVGPRTMEHLESQLGATNVELTDAVLDRIDEIVPPAVNVNPGDDGWTNPALEPSARRR